MMMIIPDVLDIYEFSSSTKPSDLVNKLRIANIPHTVLQPLNLFN